MHVTTGATDNVDINPLNTADVIAATGQSAYFCKVYYEKIASLEWTVKLIIVRRLNALVKVNFASYISLFYSHFHSI